MSDQDLKINIRDFTPGQQQQITEITGHFIEALCMVAPRLVPHFKSGGVMQLQTMSGASIKVGFSPQQGGLILPGGITPNPGGLKL